MLETFKERLKAKSTAAGANISQKRIDAIADKLHTRFPDLAEEKDYDEKIDDVYDASYLKELAALDDYERTKAAKEKKDKEERKPKEKPEDGKDEDEMPEWFKSFKEENEKRFAEINAEKSKQGISTKLKERLKEVPEKFWSKRMQPEKEDDIEIFAKDVETDFTDFAPSEKNGFQPGRPSGRASNKPSDKEVNNLVDGLMNVQPQTNNN